MAAISAAYIEAREALARIKNYRGDKRRRTYRRMAEASPIWWARMNNFAALLGLPTAGEVFYNDPAPEYCEPAQPAQTAQTEQQTKKHMANKTSEALAGLKYGQTLNEAEAAAVAAEWQKAMKKAGAAMRAAAGHFEITQPTAPSYPGPRYLVAGRYRGDLLAYIRDKVAETMARRVYYSSPFNIYSVVYKDYLTTEEAAAALAARLEAVRVTFADSINGGNCRPGTLSFVNRVADVLGYEPESLSGAEVLEFGRRFGLELYARRAVKAAARREAGK